MKRSIYLKLEDIPEADRADYLLCTEQGSPNFNKYVLQLDGAHPVQLKNTELLAEKQTRETTHQSSILQKEAQITTLTAERDAAKQAQGLPAGQVAVAASDATLLQQYKALGEVTDVKAKIEEHPQLKETVESVKRKDILTEAAKAHGLNPDAFIGLAEPRKLAEMLEMREIDDGKGQGGKVKHYFVKHKDAQGADTTTVLGDFVKNDDAFKPFLASLTTTTADGKTVTIPNNGTGVPPPTTSGAAAYIGKAYKRPDAPAKTTA